MNHHRPNRLVPERPTQEHQGWFRRLLAAVRGLIDADLDRIHEVELSRETFRLGIVSAFGDTPRAFGWENDPPSGWECRAPSPADDAVLYLPWRTEQLRPLVTRDRPAGRRVERWEGQQQTERVA